MRRLLALAALVLALPASAAVNIEYVAVRDPDNPADTATNCLTDAPDCGSVPYDYAISKYEVTNAQYAEFLNAVAADDPNELYNPMMGSNSQVGGITRSGEAGSYSYAAKAGFENKPVVYVSFWDAVSFANWLHNGEPTGAQDATTTEDGAYTISQWIPFSRDLDIVESRNPGARFFVPSENEWYKAAYYDPVLPGYYEYPAGADAETTCAAPSATPNTANCLAVEALTDVGAYGSSDSPYGTFDQGGNVWEWNETYRSSYGFEHRGIRGGSWGYGGAYLAASGHGEQVIWWEDATLGFRVARPVPEPAQVLLVLTGGLVLAAARRKRRA